MVFVLQLFQSLFFGVFLLCFVFLAAVVLQTPPGVPEAQNDFAPRLSLSHLLYVWLCT